MLITFSACEKVYDPIYEIKDSVMVLNTTFAPDSSWQIKVSSSKSPYILNDISIISDAKIEVEDHNGNIINDFHFENNGEYYTNNRKIEQGHYKISVSQKDYKSIRSKSSIPNKIIIDSISTETTFTVDNEKVLKIDLFISSLEESYIMLKHIVKKKALSKNNDTISYLDTAWIKSVGNDFEEVIPDYVSNQNLFLEYKKGNDNTFSFLSFEGFVKEENLIEGTSYFEVFSCSKEFYTYQKSLQLFNWNREQNNSSIINPYPVFSNIENGLGIFAGFNKNVIKNKFK